MSEAAVSQDQLAKDEVAAMYDWLSELGSHAAIKAKLIRVKPKTHVYKGRVVNCGGTLDEYEEPVTEEQIKQEHGGGKFQLIVQSMKPNANGKMQWKFGGSRTFEIAGDPDVRRLLLGTDEDQDNGANDGAVAQAMNMSMRMAQAAEERADAAAANGGMDTDVMRMMMEPLQQQLNVLTAALTAKEGQVFELLSKPVDNSGQERLFGIMESKETAHGNNIEAIRTAHDSEMRSVRSFNRDEMARRESRFEKELDNNRTATERTIENLKDANRMALDSQRVGYDMRIDGLKDQKKQLDRELTEVKTELATLRGRKDMTPVQQMQGLVEIKNAMEAVMPSAAEEAPKAGWERALDAVMGSPFAEGVAERIAQGGPAPAADADADPMVSIRRPDGQIVQVPASYIAQMQAQKAARAQASGTDDGTVPPTAAPEPEISIDPDDVQKAVIFIEAAIRNGTEAEIFAASARNMLPADILSYIKTKGVDHFLNNVAKLEDGSPLATVVGRTFVRKVVKFLLEGTTEGIDDPAAESPMES